MQNRFPQMAVPLFAKAAVALAVSTLSLAAAAQSVDAAVSAEASAARQRVGIVFVPTVDNTPVSCNAVLRGLGTTGANAKLQDLRFYVAGTVNGVAVEEAVRLDANSYQYTSSSDSVALIDMENAAGLCAGDEPRHMSITGTVPVGTYNKLIMTLGVPESLNHSATSTAPAPLNNTDMAWSWQSGRKFIKIEINPQNTKTKAFAQGIAKYDSAGNLTGAYNDSFYFHLGNTGCAVAPTTAAGYACTSDNTLPLHIHGFDYKTQRVAVDLKALFAQSNLQQEHGGAPGCMSGATDPECQAMWGVIGSSFVPQTTSTGSIVYVSTHDLSDAFFHGETVFRAISK